MTPERKAELFDNAITWIWEHTENHGIEVYKSALKKVGYTKEEIVEELLSCNFDDEYNADAYCPSSTNGDYSPSNPWDAPGMSIRDFIR
jgi:hypothetical protein